MAKRVRTERPVQASPLRIRLEDLPEADARETGAPAARVDEQPRARAPAEERLAPLADVAAHPRGRFVADRHQPLLVALPRAREEGRLQVQVGRPQVDEL